MLPESCGLGQFHVSLVMAKSRVAPLKPVNIVRLELAAAVLSIKLDKMMKDELDVKLEESVFWTDAMAVLQYINNKDRRFQIFVTNRLAIIHENSSVSQWRHVTSQINPADYASRGMDTGDSVKLNQWLSGPMFLQQEETAWPKKKIVGKIDGQDPELKKETHFCSVNTKDKDVLQFLSERYSDWK